MHHDDVPAEAARAGVTLEDLLSVFAAMPGAYLLLAADSPRFTMLVASDVRLAATLTTREGTIGRGMFEVFPEDNPEDTERSGEVNLRASYERVLRTREPHRMATQRYDIRRPDGAWEVRYWSPINVPVPGPDGEVRFILHRADDITEEVLRSEELERAERRAASLLARMSDAHMVLDAELRVVDVNHAAERLVGLPGGELRGRRHGDLFRTPAGEEAARLYRRVIAEGVERHFPASYRAGERDVHVEIDAYPTEEGGVAVFWRDVTQRVCAQAEIERSLAEAERANQAKSEFIAMMSHELRTPLNAIGGYVELIEMGIHGPVTDAQRDALARIQRSQRALLSRINEVLNYARLETGAVTYDLTEVRVADAVGAAEVLVAPQLRARGLGYSWLGCEPSLAVRADPDKLQQILLNLLSNAIKFTEARDGQRGRVDVGCGMGEDGRVLIHVRDTGIGIPEDKVAAVFEPFVQVDSTLTRTQQGTGLGLAISRDLARGMGGDLSVESTPGVGSTFTLALPQA